jgi:transglutaminase-like putative cysteine protease
MWVMWLGDLSAWLSLRQPGVMGWPMVPLSIARFVYRRSADFGARLWWDARAIAGGGSFWDTHFYVLLVAFLIWAIGFFAVWQIYRRRSALVALVPSGVILAGLAFLHPDTIFYLFIFLFCLMWLVAVSQLWTYTDRWDRVGADYPEGMGLELAFSLAPWILALLLVAGFLPNMGLWRVSRAFWEQAEKVFGPFEHEYSGDLGSEGGLPRSHMLGGSPVLGDTLVFYVTTNDPPPPIPDAETPDANVIDAPRRYWRGDTLDVYTGRGWTSSPMEARNVPATQLLDPVLSDASHRFELLQEYERAAPGDSLLYAANAPARVDHAVQTWWRGPGDLARITSEADRYSVISRPPEPTVAELRAAESYVPPEIAERYLDLPQTLPERVLDLAEHVVGDADTDYDRARTIETYLRTYSYTLEIQTPPAGRDLVEYFLFDLQQGYCDYYASAMVVMARAVGLPARFATGYAQGEYDFEAQRWVVTELSGHSWAEVYFDGLGWIGFEPTAGQPGLVRLGGDDLLRPSVPPLPPRAAGWWTRIPWGLIGMGMLLAALLAGVGWVWWSAGRRESSATGLVRDRYSRLLRWGDRLGQPARDGQTVSEHSGQLQQAVKDRGLKSRWSPVRQAGAEAQLDIEQLADAFHQAQYGRQPLSDRDGWRMRDLWVRLRRRLWWLWLARD